MNRKKAKKRNGRLFHAWTTIDLARACERAVVFRPGNYVFPKGGIDLTARDAQKRVDACYAGKS